MKIRSANNLGENILLNDLPFSVKEFYHAYYAFCSLGLREVHVMLHASSQAYAL